MELIPDSNRNLLKLAAPTYDMLQDEVTDAMFTVRPVGDTLKVGPIPIAEMNMFRDQNAAWWNSAWREHMFTLASAERIQRARALKNVIHFACFYPDRIDLEPATQTLFAIYQADPDHKNRLLALAALDLIGSETALRCLADGATRQEDPLIRRATSSVLNEHFKDRIRS